MKCSTSKFSGGDGSKVRVVLVRTACGGERLHGNHQRRFLTFVEEKTELTARIEAQLVRPVEEVVTAVIVEVAGVVVDVSTIVIVEVGGVVVVFAISVVLADSVIVLVTTVGSMQAPDSVL